MEFDLNDKGDIGKVQASTNCIKSIFSYRDKCSLARSVMTVFSQATYNLLNLLICAQCSRYDGVKTYAGKTRIGQNSLRAEKDDVRGGWKSIEGHNQLPRLPEHDAGETKCNSEADPNVRRNGKGAGAEGCWSTFTQNLLRPSLKSQSHLKRMFFVISAKFKSPSDGVWV
ncbi:hypothetical protein AMECASPLE_027104 [Ameca splendens]|uniref:Uncharacterized protein n=1 Tax=Ameca splendens TaxID=208324 RepID=A0ABV0YST0_9TELE